MLKKKINCVICKSAHILSAGAGEDRIFSCQNCLLEWRVGFFSYNKVRRLYTKDYYDQKETLNRGYFDYDLFLDSFQNYFSWQLSRLQKYFPNGGRLIDVGCGFGVFLNEARNKGYDVKGIDILPKAAKEAWKRYKIRVITSDFENAKLPSNSTDIITCFQTLEHMINPLLFLKEVHHILKPSGLLLITTPDIGCFWKKILGNRWFSYKHKEHLFFWHRRSLQLALEQCNFREIIFFSDNVRWYDLLQLSALIQAYGGNFGFKIGGGLRKIVLPKYLAVPFPIGSIGVMARKVT